MKVERMSKKTKYNRRHFLSTAAITIAAAELSLFDFSNAQSNKTNQIDKTTNSCAIKSPFDILKQIDAGVLNIGYTEAGNADGTQVILLHGWLYDIHSFVEVTLQLVLGITCLRWPKWKMGNVMWYWEQ